MWFRKIFSLSNVFSIFARFFVSISILFLDTFGLRLQLCVNAFFENIRTPSILYPNQKLKCNDKEWQDAYPFTLFGDFKKEIWIRSSYADTLLHARADGIGKERILRMHQRQCAAEHE